MERLIPLVNFPSAEFGEGTSNRFTPQVVILLGRAKAGLTSRLIQRVLECGMHREPFSIVWLVPSYRAARAVRERLIGAGLPATVGLWLGTYDALATEVLGFSDRVFTPIDRSARWELIRLVAQDLAEKKDLSYFAPIVHTRGFVDRLYHWISQCQRAGLGPESLKNSLGGNSTPAIEDFLRVYQQYEDCLRRLGFLDAHSRLWAAAEQMKKGHFGPFGAARLLLVDGFTDFLPAEAAILQSLGTVVSEALITLLYDRDRPELFSKTKQTLAELRKIFPQEICRTEAVESASPFETPGLCHLEKYLFCQPGSAPTPADTGGLQILVGANVQQEVELVAREIKKLLVDGDPLAPGRRVLPQDVLVVVRSAAEYADRIWETFREFGIPIFLEAGVPIYRVGVIRAFLALVKLGAEGWSRGNLLAVLHNEYIRPECWPAERDRWLPQVERVLRQLGIVSGKERLRQRLSTLGSACENQRNAADPSAIQLALQVVEGLLALFSDWENPASLSGWIARWMKLVEDCRLLRRGSGIKDSLESSEDDFPGNGRISKDEEWRFLDSLDQRAWECLLGTLHRLERLYLRLDRAGDLLELDKAAALLGQLVQGLEVLPEPEEDGRVRVLSPTTVRLLTAPYVFVMGLAQGSFPSAAQEFSFWTEREASRLRELGMEPESLPARLEAETLLFYQVVTRARRRLYLSYPAADDKGEPLLRSPFVDEVEIACGPNRIARQSPKNLSPIPLEQEPFNLREWRVLAIHQALEGKMDLLGQLASAGFNLPMAAGIDAGLRLRSQRGRFHVFTAFDGMLCLGRVGKNLEKAFDSSRGYSPTELEYYTGCPFRFLMARILRLEPLVEVAVQTDHARRGERIHSALACFHRHLRDRFGDKVCSQHLQQLSGEELRTLWEESFEGRPGGTASEVELWAWELDRRCWMALFERYLEQWREYDQFCREQFGTVFYPEFFEVQIGNDGSSANRKGRTHSWGRSSSEFARSGVYKLPFGIHGRIDRIDVGETMDGRKYLIILDYKSGGSAPVTKGRWVQCLQEGRGLQLALYLLAAASEKDLRQHGTPILGGYWLLGKSGLDRGTVLWVERGGSPGKSELSERDVVLEDLREEELPRICRAIVKALRRGHFPPKPRSEKECSGCAYRTVCRVAECRSLEKDWAWLEPDDKPDQEAQ
jgi:ATP-dependent helicase/DNAse subunit B